MDALLLFELLTKLLLELASTDVGIDDAEDVDGLITELDEFDLTPVN